MRDEILTLTKRGYELFGKGDLESLREMFTEDIVWRTVGKTVFEPEYKGIDAVLGYFTKLFEFTGGTFKNEPLHVLADDDRAAVIQQVTASRESKLLDTRMVLVFEIRDLKVYEVTEFTSEPSMLEAFWA